MDIDMELFLKLARAHGAKIGKAEKGSGGLYVGDHRITENDINRMFSSSHIDETELTYVQKCLINN